jgi:hypothetical protein
LLGNILAVTHSSERITKRIRWIVLLWLVAVISVGGMAVMLPSVYGMDVQQCWIAIQSVGHGGSAYADGIAAMTAYHGSHPAGDRGPVLLYIYSPLTIPLLHFLSWFPKWLLCLLYGGAVGTGFLLQLRGGYEMATAKERGLVYLLPFVAFFPGLLGDVTILVGNIAYILYGLVLLAAIPGWKRNRWFWFYVAVIIAFSCKAPMLTLLLFPLLVGRRQWLPVGMTAAFCGLLLAIQHLLWPVEFQRYLSALRLACNWQHSFGLGPAGFVGTLLWKMGKPYSLITTMVYLGWAVALMAFLLVIGRCVGRRGLSRENWIPVAFLGTVMMNPRLTFLDNVPLTIPMLLIAWRSLLLLQKRFERRKMGRASVSFNSTSAPSPYRDRKTLAPVVTGVGCFVACNIADMIWGDLFPMELTLLLLIFALGVWLLFSAEEQFPQNDPLRQTYEQEEGEQVERLTYV